MNIQSARLPVDSGGSGGAGLEAQRHANQSSARANLPARPVLATGPVKRAAWIIKSNGRDFLFALFLFSNVDLIVLVRCCCCSSFRVFHSRPAALSFVHLLSPFVALAFVSVERTQMRVQMTSKSEKNQQKAEQKLNYCSPVCSLGRSVVRLNIVSGPI